MERSVEVMLPEYYNTNVTTKEASQKTNIPTNTISNYIRKGVIPRRANPNNRTWAWILDEDLEKLVAEYKKPKKKWGHPKYKIVSCKYCGKPYKATHRYAGHYTEAHAKCYRKNANNNIVFNSNQSPKHKISPSLKDKYAAIDDKYN